MRHEQVNETSRAIQFDFEFCEYLKKYQTSAKVAKQRHNLFSNGMMLAQYLTFKVILTMPDEQMDTANISDRYHKFIGTGINQPSLARALIALDTIGLVKFINNPLDKRMKNVQLTKDGKKLQYLFMGSNKVYPQMETAVQQIRYHSKRPA